MSNFNTARKPEIPTGIVDKWQRLLNLMAEIVGVPAGLIMKIDPPEIEVYISSKTEGNPYHKGERANLNTGLYCETVMQKREPLLVPDATKDPKWDHNPDIKLGMVYYLGFPLEWPDTQIFGTICVLDYKDNPKSTKYKELIFEFSEIIRTDLENIVKRYELEREKEKLKESEEKFRELFDNMANGVAVYDAIDGGNDFVFKDMNKSGQKVSKVDITKIKGKSILEVFPGVKDLGLFDIFKKVYKTGKFAYLPTTMYKDDRIFQWVENYVYKLPSGEIVAVYDDITEKKSAEKALIESEERFKSYVENANDIIYTLTLDGIFTYVSPSWTRLLGHAINEVENHPFQEFMHPDDLQEAIEFLDRTIKTGENQANIEYRVLHKNGTWRWHTSNASPIHDATGKVVSFLGIARDITNRKQAEELLKQSQEKYRELVENANSIIAKFDKDGRVISMNEYGLKFFGYTEDELIGKLFSETILPKVESTGRVLENLLTEIASNVDKYTNNINENIKKNGERVWIYWTNKPVYDSNGDVIAILCVGNDITERINLEKALLESEEKFKSISNSAQDAIITMDNDGNITYWNKVAENIFDYSSQEVLGKDLHMVIAPKKCYDNFQKGMSDFKLTGKGNAVGITLELSALRKNGEEFPVELSLSAVKSRGKWGAVGIIRDITERKKAEEKVKTLNEALRVLNKILRHDILNDLTVVMSACDMIHTDDEKMKQKAAKAIRKSVSLIEQMRELENALVSDEDLSEKSLRSVAESLVKNYPDIKFSIKGDCNVLCDEALSSVIDNLVRNAIVHGKTDRIDISIHDKDGNCEMRIADYGKGIPDDIKDRIFGEGESFGDTRGSGLGLYIVKKVMERYGGEISLEDNKPNGAVFILKFKKQ